MSSGFQDEFKNFITDEVSKELEFEQNIDAVIYRFQNVLDSFQYINNNENLVKDLLTDLNKKVENYKQKSAHTDEDRKRMVQALSYFLGTRLPGCLTEHQKKLLAAPTLQFTKTFKPYLDEISRTSYRF
ncbi:hypothetical protein [Candidiatus Paracoxiella cheracis]|uniref:hypothetical protein n=1 Tax=Candidiatus Paracoxiella cheracis TaxID=3405120 RepID=UPI003BF47616